MDFGSDDPRVINPEIFNDNFPEKLNFTNGSIYIFLYYLFKSLTTITKRFYHLILFENKG